MTEFKEFTLNELFDKIPTKTIPYKKSELPTIPNDYYNIPAVSAGIGNKGVSVYAHDADCTVLENCISISANGQNSGVSFFQNRKFTILQDSYAIRWSLTDDVPNQNQYLYLLTKLHKLLIGHFDWINKAGWNNIKGLVVQIPVSGANSGTPDWAYMDKYIQQIQQKYIEQKQVEYQKRVQTFDEAVGTKLSDTEIDAILKRYYDAEFNEFRIGDLFEKIEQGSRLKSSDQFFGKIPFVSSGFVNMGISNYISNPIEVISANSLTIDIFGNVFYRDYEYTISDDVGAYWNKNKPLSIRCMLYLQTSIQKALIGKFSYSKKLRATKSINLICELPTTSTNIPDYTLMEDYIKVIQQKYVRNLEAQLYERIEIAKQLI